MNLASLCELSGSLCDFNTVLTSAVDCLTALPQHPYLFTKELLFGKDYKFPTVDDVEIPEGITTEGMIEKITEFETSYQKTLIDSMTNPQEYDIRLPDNHLSFLAELSGEDTKTYIVTQDKLKNYIEYIEMVKAVDINSITPDNATTIINKLGYYYINMVNKKTVK